MRYRNWAALLLAAVALGIGYWVGLAMPSPSLRELDSHGEAATRKSSAKSAIAANAITPETISVRAGIAKRSARASAPLPPIDTPLQKIYADLAARAHAGDTAAAMRLVYDLQRCRMRDAMSSVTDLVANRFRSEAGTVTAKQTEEQNAELKGNLDYLDKMDALCTGITPEQIDRRGEWLREAASDGDPEAMVCYAANPFDFGPKPLSDAWFDWAEQWRTDAPQFVAQALSAGQADVIPLLQDAYSAGLQITDTRYTTYPFGQLMTPDPTLAYTYTLLFEKVAPEKYLSSVQRMAIAAQESLNADQIAQAQAFADAEWPRFAAQAGNHDNILPCYQSLYQAAKQ